MIQLNEYLINRQTKADTSYEPKPGDVVLLTVLSNVKQFPYVTIGMIVRVSHDIIYFDYDYPDKFFFPKPKGMDHHYAIKMKPDEEKEFVIMDENDNECTVTKYARTMHQQQPVINIWNPEDSIKILKSLLHKSQTRQRMEVAGFNPGYGTLHVTTMQQKMFNTSDDMFNDFIKRIENAQNR
jgi:hypothetical protein